MFLVTQTERLELVVAGHARLEDIADIWHVFTPDQETIERKLAIRAHRFHQACKAQADFLAEHCYYIGDKTEGTHLASDSMLDKEDEIIKAMVKEAKAEFWRLYDKLKGLHYTMRDGWREYLTHAGVGPDHPDVVEFVQRLDRQRKNFVV
jgi:hypothetical protein